MRFHYDSSRPRFDWLTAVELGNLAVGQRTGPVAVDRIQIVKVCLDAAGKRQGKVLEVVWPGNRAIWVDGWKAVSLHGQRMPWNVNVVIPFEDDVWGPHRSAYC